jgi:hypothetical protein
MIITVHVEQEAPGLSIFICLINLSLFFSGNAGGKKRGPFGRLCSKLGPIESGDPLWYNSFEQASFSILKTLI